MFGLPSGRRGLAAWTILFAASIPPAAAESRLFGALAVPDPARETAAPADAGLTAACQAGARERLGQERLEFARASHTARDGTRIARMDVTAAGQSFRAVCTRDGAGAVETVVFAAPLDEVGPRVVVLGGTGMPARSDDGYRFVARDPARATGDDMVGYGGSYLPGLWVPDDERGFRSRGFRDGDSHVFVKRRSSSRSTVRIVEGGRRGSSAPFSDGGIASPAISNFTPKAVRGGGTIRFRSGGGGVRIGGSFGR
jgi:hypothetical protein